MFKIRPDVAIPVRLPFVLCSGAHLPGTSWAYPHAYVTLPDQCEPRDRWSANLGTAAAKIIL